MVTSVEMPTGQARPATSVRIGPVIEQRERRRTTTSDGLRLPPGPGFSFERLSGFRREHLPWMMRATARRWPGVAYLGLLGRHLYLVSEPELVRQVLIADGRKVDKGEALRTANIVLGEGLITAKRELHLPRRRLVNPAFAHARMAGYSTGMVDAARAADARWQDGQRVDFAREMSRLTLDIIGRTVLGADLDAQWQHVGKELTLALRGWEAMMVPGGAWYLKLPLEAPRRFWAAADNLHEIVRRILAVDTGGESVVDEMRRARDNGAALDDDALHDETMNLMLAGHETTALALTWAFWLLSRHPGEAAALRESLTDALGDREPGYGDLRELHRAYAVVAETLRLFPPAWILEREAEQDLTLGEWTAPAGSTVLASQFVLHRDPRFWPSPDAFRPERWLDADGRFSEENPGVPRGSWYPFGAGTRICIGESFAWTEAVLVLAVLARRWSLRVDPEHRMALHAAITLRPAHGLPGVLRRAE
ncbi:cytochrome P450 [Cryptosporangium aurantiacum]|uniref:Cytochrome P450 n=1 Tax=Cryptosporangium aurantiacum TaxID=134849 RepID=A0A1M7ID80_9ACTN|nr:cytochrome P450 [Cryptosporangium aurantiacum]SHM38714.1 Cytochrome P450 [Cryptosporangium aurantiacum]